MEWTEIRPWGRFLNLFESENTKVKLIEVDPHKRMSYQSHEKRSEVWTVVSGDAEVVINEVVHKLSVGESIRVPCGAKHRMGNLSVDASLRIIEVQTGEYFGEDDIRRYSDDFGRINV